MQRWDAIGGVLKRRGHPSIVPPTAKAAGKLLRAELDAFQGVGGRLLRAELNAVQNQAGQLLRAELDAVQPSNITSVPLSSFQQNGDTFEVALTRLTTPTIVDLEGTTQSFSDFDQGGNVYGVYSPNVIGFTNGALQMVPSSSTHAAAVNAQGNGTTVQETLLRLGRGGGTVTTPYMGADLIGTTQGHIYNGVVIYLSTNAVIENCSFYGIPGSASAPPGETFSINNYKSTGTIIRNVLVDGQGLAASGTGNNACTTILVQNSTFKNMGHGHGVAHYQSSDITYQGCQFLNNRNAGANFEKCFGTLTLQNCTFSGNERNMIVDTDGTSAVVNIYDPIWDGMNTGTKFQVLVHTRYAYPPVASPPLNQQNPADIHLFQNGVEVSATKLQIVSS